MKRPEKRFQVTLTEKELRKLRDIVNKAKDVQYEELYEKHGRAWPEEVKAQWIGMLSRKLLDTAVPMDAGFWETRFYLLAKAWRAVGRVVRPAGL
jgi:acetoin utilization deacetylase AcuC-like enzyme